MKLNRRQTVSCSGFFSWPLLWPFLLVVMLSCSAQLLADDGLQEYLVETRVWMDGELQGEPSLQVQAGSDARIENRSGQTAWAMSVNIQPAHASEKAMDGAIWLDLAIEEEIDGTWQFLADTMLGLPPGQTGTVSVVGQDIETATPENAELFVEVTVRPTPAE